MWQISAAAYLVAARVRAPKAEWLGPVDAENVVVTLREEGAERARVRLARVGHLLELVFRVVDRARPVGEKRQGRLSAERGAVAEVPELLQEGRDRVLVFKL
jgi:hypothetical protein